MKAKHHLMSIIADNTRKAFFFLAYTEIRPYLRFLQEEGKRNLVGCEIGVSRGMNAIRMLKNLSIKELYLIEPDRKAVGLDMFNRYGDKTTFIFDYSYNIASVIPDGSLDFCYIDGEHTYDAVKQDIRLFLPKIRRGGLIAGHDFNIYGVAKAVVEELGDGVMVDGYPVDWWKRV